ncbi:MAG TPA: hypothetical protein VFQ63_02565 [Patescibacteria group bacterium]|nr:hypothetical protein [Patescibacteria group bacterium]
MATEQWTQQATMPDKRLARQTSLMGRVINAVTSSTPLTLDAGDPKVDTIIGSLTQELQLHPSDAKLASELSVYTQAKNRHVSPTLLYLSKEISGIANDPLKVRVLTLMSEYNQFKLDDAKTVRAQWPQTGPMTAELKAFTAATIVPSAQEDNPYAQVARMVSEALLVKSLQKRLGKEAITPLALQTYLRDIQPVFGQRIAEAVRKGVPHYPEFAALSEAIDMLGPELVNPVGAFTAELFGRSRRLKLEAASQPAALTEQAFAEVPVLTSLDLSGLGVEMSQQTLVQAPTAEALLYHKEAREDITTLQDRVRGNNALQAAGVDFRAGEGGMKAESLNGDTWTLIKTRISPNGVALERYIFSKALPQETYTYRSGQVVPVRRERQVIYEVPVNEVNASQTRVTYREVLRGLRPDGGYGIDIPGTLTEYNAAETDLALIEAEDMLEGANGRPGFLNTTFTSVKKI